MTLVNKKCKWCHKQFQAKKADVARGWAKCCSKSCAVSLREKKLNRGSSQRQYNDEFFDEDFAPFGSEESFQSYF